MRFIRKVLHGEKLGRKLGFPTVNFHVGKFGEHFQTGVYSCIVRIEGPPPAPPKEGGKIQLPALFEPEPQSRRPSSQLPALLGALYFGPKGTGKNVLEIHLLDFSGDLYGQRVSFEVVGKKIRSPKKAKNLEELKAMIDADIQKIKALPESA